MNTFMNWSVYIIHCIENTTIPVSPDDSTSMQPGEEQNTF